MLILSKLTATTTDPSQAVTAASALPSALKGTPGAELHIYFLVRLESIYYQIFLYSKIVPNCAVAK